MSKNHYWVYGIQHILHFLSSQSSCFDHVVIALKHGVTADGWGGLGRVESANICVWNQGCVASRAVEVSSAIHDPIVSWANYQNTNS